MVLQGPPIHNLDVSIVTPRYQITGQLETVGRAFTYINNEKRNSFSLHDVSLAPLVGSGPLQSFSRPHVILRRSEIALLYFVSAEVRASVQTLRRRELLVAYTPVAVCRAHFHMADEANVNDFLEDIASVLLPITEVQVFPLNDLPAPFPTEPELLLVGRSYLEFYHPA
ncbi:MAG: hypothetical protein DRI81_13950 [Chloroflexi bacterium]|nr:MAG: hypothetical protein DRI81_13950 [Chloroflexota bacterium]